MFSGNLKYVYLLFAVILLNGCAPTNSALQRREIVVFDSDFGTGLNANVEYKANPEKTSITLHVENTNKLFLDIWVSQSYSAKGMETIYSRRLIETNEIFVESLITAAKIEKGVVETIKFKLYDKQGKVLFITTPIYSDDSDWIKKSEAELYEAYPWLLDRGEEAFQSLSGIEQSPII